MTVSREGYAWVLEAPGRPLVRRARTWGDPPEGLALVAVLGCGICHTDVGFASGEVAPRAALPLVLGHEIVGRVIHAAGEKGERLVGRRVLAPAVSPCGRCKACTRGRPTACPKGRMPGNDADGGFATHALVPIRDLLALDSEPDVSAPLGAARLEAWELAPVADAVSTAYQAVVRAGLAKGEVAVFVGTGGVGGFGLQIARALGARTVAVDVDPRRLAALEGVADEPIDASSLDVRELRTRVRARIAARGWTGETVRVFETSGTPTGQAGAWELLERGGSLSVVGFTMEKIPLRLSNAMALDVDLHGNWGCDPALFPAVMRLVLGGDVQIRPFIERRPLDSAGEVLEAVRAHRIERRAVLVP